MSINNSIDRPATFVPNSEGNPGALARTPESQECAVRELVAKALKACKRQRTRKSIAEELSALTGQRISKEMLDDWASPSKKGLRLPAFLIKPLCEITGDDALALAVVPSHLHKYITVGRWLMESRWVLDMVSVKLKKQGRELLRARKVLRREIERRRRG